MAKSRKGRLPPPLRYTPEELANEWGVSVSYIWQQIEAGGLKAEARDDRGKWRKVEPHIAREIDFGSGGLSGGNIHVGTSMETGISTAGYVDLFHWSKGNVRVTHEARQSFEQLAIKDAAQESLSTRERTTLLIIVAALAEEAKIKLDKPSKAAALIENLTVRIGARVAARTIEEHLKGIPDARERRLES